MKIAQEGDDLAPENLGFLGRTKLAVFGGSKTLLSLIQYGFLHLNSLTGKCIAYKSGGELLETYTEETG